MKAKPYVGITGLKTHRDVAEISRMFEENGFNADSSHQPMFGYLVSEKRLRSPEKCYKRSPPAEILASLASYAPENILTMMHYHTKNLDSLAEQVKQLFSLGDMYENGFCRAVQLNVVWPELNRVQEIMGEFPDMKIVLWLPSSDSVESIANRAKEYDSLVTYALIDPSGGLGKEFDIGRSTELMAALNEAMPTTRIGVAGGFSGDNVGSVVGEIQKRYDNKFFIDSEGRLRSTNDLVLDFAKVRMYIEEAGKILLK
tara:strand:+ start:382 stop:1152 length:771 start_codon:yes stop_codon:yes gene_type:complete